MIKLNFAPQSITLFIAINGNGDIVNDNDYENLGPAFSSRDIEEWENDEGMLERYALRIDKRCRKQSGFSISNCRLWNAVTFAKAYCTKHGVKVKSRGWVKHTDWRNIYEVIDENGIEYHFHISRKYDSHGYPVDWEPVHISINNHNEFIYIEDITNIRQFEKEER